jgi:hypothetical protein
MIAATDTTSHARTRVALATLVATIAVVAIACGSDDDADTVPVTAAVESTAPAATDSAPDDTTPTDTVGVIEIEAVDYSFENLPDSVPAGTRLALTNTANAELHELVAVRLDDGEARPVQELMQLPEAELGAIIGAGPPAAVLLAAPGGAQIAAVGDGTLTEPGRYLLLCAIPSGVAPEVYLEAAAASGGAPPQVEGGPPHFVHGMFAELTVD